MVLTNIDSIVRRWLLETGRPIHYYAEGLYNASTCLRELCFDSLQMINTVRLPITDYFAVDLPEDFVDEVMVGILANNFIHPMAKAWNLADLRLIDASTGQYVTYGSYGDNTEFSLAGLPPFTRYNNFNEYNEPIGRFFGINGASKQNLYSISKNRRQIQLTETFTAQSIVLIYISDGQTVDSATQIDTQAFSTIQAFMEWKRSRNANNLQSPEAYVYYNERRLLRARLNDTTLDDIRNIIRRNFHAGLKN